MAVDSEEPGQYFAADYEAVQERARLALLETLGDPWTVRTFGIVGVAPGWRCLEVGAGGGSVARWLGAKVGPTGHVVAADLDPRFLGELPALGIEVRRCDITCEEIESAAYDLVHCRALVMHMSDPVDVLRRMGSAVRPGGWLVVEEPDYSTTVSLSPDHPTTPGFHSYLHARYEFLTATKVMDLHYGSTLPTHFEELGLEAVGNEASLSVERGGSLKSKFLVQSFIRVDEAMVAAGAAEESDVVDARRALQDPTFVYRSPAMLAAWARQPSV